METRLDRFGGSPDRGSASGSEVEALKKRDIQALQKIENGIYGECEGCGETISVKRIRARPVAELCIDCKSEQEQLERREG